MRRNYNNSLGRTPLTSKNNRKSTKARKWLHNFIKGVYDKKKKSKVNSEEIKSTGMKMSIQDAYYHSKGPKAYSEYLHRRGVEL